MGVPYILANATPGNTPVSQLDANWDYCLQSANQVFDETGETGAAKADLSNLSAAATATLEALLAEIPGDAIRLLANDPTKAAQNQATLQSAITAAIAANQRELRLEPGKYYVRCASQNGNMMMALITGVSDTFILNGQGAELVLTWSTLADLGVLVNVVAPCLRVSITDLSLSVYPPLHAQGVVTAVGANSITVATQAGTSQPQFTTATRCLVYSAAEDAFTDGGGGDGTVGTLSQPSGSSFTYTNSTIPATATVGATVVVVAQEYIGDTISAFGVKQFGVRDVSIGASVGHGVVTGDCGDHLIDVTIRRDPGSLLSTTADGIHIANASGRIVLKGCVVDGCGDDGLNIHGSYWNVVSSPSSASLLVNFAVNQYSVYDAVPAVGDIINVASPADETSLANLTVQSVAATATPGQFLVTFTGAIPGTPTANLYYDTNHDPSHVTGDIVVSANYGRGVLIQCPAVDLQVDVFGCAYSGLLITNSSFGLPQEAMPPNRVRVVGSVRGCNYKFSNSVADTAVLIDAGSLSGSPVYGEEHTVTVDVDISRAGFGGVTSIGGAQTLIQATFYDVGRLRGANGVAATVPGGVELYASGVAGLFLGPKLVSMDKTGAIYLTGNTNVPTPSPPMNLAYTGPQTIPSTLSDADLTALMQRAATLGLVVTPDAG